MAEDFGYVWRTVRLYCPSAPTFLAREWVQSAWKQLLAARRWGFMRGELSITTLPGDTAIVLPPDFASFKVVVDQARQVRIPFNYTIEELLAADPALSSAGSPNALVATSPSSTPPTVGQARYRLYPAGSPVTLTAVYHRQGDRLDDGETFHGVLADGAEVLVHGALAQAALWPGTGDKPNPYFNAGLAQTKAAEFKYGIQMLSLRDDEQYPDDLWDSWPETCDGLVGADPRMTDACAC
jgi:hypothetical protein